MADGENSTGAIVELDVGKTLEAARSRNPFLAAEVPPPERAVEADLHDAAYSVFSPKHYNLIEK